MSRIVLVVEPDVDRLGELASGLRSRGLTVVLADDLEVALERAYRQPPDAVLLAEVLTLRPDVGPRLRAAPGMAAIPCYTLVESQIDSGPGSLTLPSRDPELIARRLLSLPSRPPPVPVERGDFRGDLQQVSVADLLQLLSMNRRTGALTLSTAQGAGEVRLVDGEIVDAVYRRVEGIKALYRLIGESDGTFAFVSGGPPAHRRLEQPTHLLLLEGMRQLDETRQLLRQLAADRDALQAACAPTDDSSPAERAILVALEAPISIAELLDMVVETDLEVLRNLSDLVAWGKVRRIDHGALRVEVADPEQLGVLASRVRQLRRAGFAGAPRMVLFGSRAKLATLLHSLGRLADSSPAPDAVPTAPVAHRLVTLRFGEGAELELMGLPDDLAYSPLWGLTLAGSSGVVLLESTEGPALEQICSVFGLPLLAAEALLGQVDCADPRQVAILIRLALESLAEA